MSSQSIGDRCPDRPVHENGLPKGGLWRADRSARPEYVQRDGERRGRLPEGHSPDVAPLSAGVRRGDGMLCANRAQHLAAPAGGGSRVGQPIQNVAAGLLGRDVARSKTLIDLRQAFGIDEPGRFCSGWGGGIRNDASQFENSGRLQFHVFLLSDPVCQGT